MKTRKTGGESIIFQSDSGKEQKGTFEFMWKKLVCIILAIGCSLTFASCGIQLEHNKANRKPYGTTIAERVWSVSVVDDNEALVSLRKANKAATPKKSHKDQYCVYDAGFNSLLLEAASFNGKADNGPRVAHLLTAIMQWANDNALSQAEEEEVAKSAAQALKNYSSKERKQIKANIEDVQIIREAFFDNDSIVMDMLEESEIIEKIKQQDERVDSRANFKIFCRSLNKAMEQKNQEIKEKEKLS